MPVNFIAYPNMPNQFPYQYMPMQMMNYPQYASYPPQHFEETSESSKRPPPLQAPKPTQKIEMVQKEEEVIKKEEEEIKEIDELNILKPDKPKQRWKREDDRRMFQYLREY